MIYLDNAATSFPKPEPVYRALDQFARTSLAITHAERGGRIHVANAGAQARWRADMTELYYVASDKKLMAVPLTKRNGTLEPGLPVELFQTRIIEPILVLWQYDVHPDGQEFIINSLPRADAAAPLSLIVNWEQVGQ